MEPPPPPPPPLSHTTYTLTASTISYAKPAPTFLFKPCSSTPPTNILNNVSLTAHPSEILAIVGPSGAGKSTLLDILAARTAATSGALLLNSAPLNPSAYRKLSAYVPQHDACLPLLTVAETFAFSAALLNPKSANIPAIVSALLDDLRLTHLAQVRLAHGLSGGERRRVSIGLSLLHDPAVLLLDEPTSGLDSRSALSIMQILRSVTETRRRTVVLSIHQPSFKILSTIDRILLLAQGSVVHHGTLSSLEDFLLSNGFTVPPQLNPLEYAMEILNQLQSPPPPPPPPPIEIGIGDTMRSRYRSSRIHEITLLYLRFWKIIYRTKQLLIWAVRLHPDIPALLDDGDAPDLHQRAPHPPSRSFERRVPPLLSPDRQHSGVPPVPPGHRRRLLRLRLLPSGAVHDVAGVRVLRGGDMVDRAHGQLLRAVSELRGAKFHRRNVAADAAAGRILPLLRLLHLEGQAAQVLALHALHLHVQVRLGCAAHQRVLVPAFHVPLWYDKGSNACMINGRDFLERRGLHERQRWTNVYVMIGFFLLYRLLCFMVLIRRVSRSKK
uniref:ABC transporter n=1 Tax=Salvia miltiorrhiza TaxID=226208 RepID=A0A8E7D9E3_SALMI|nr:ABC transporter [Salvia miltiorrhiza]